MRERLQATLVLVTWHAELGTFQQVEGEIRRYEVPVTVERREPPHSDAAIDLRRSMLIPRVLGTLRSGRVLASRPPFEEGLFVYVIWDGLPTPEKWSLVDLEPAQERAA